MTRFMYICKITATVMLFAQTALAVPVAYDFDYDSSEINFTYDFNGDTITGVFPEFTGNLIVDFQNIKNSEVSVSIDATKGRGGFVFATSALRGPKILDVKNFPTINFISTDARLSDGRAAVDGNITVHGVTRPIRLKVLFFQFEGQSLTARDELLMVVTGRINRHDFGANGYPDAVGEFLDIKIDARIIRRR